ARIAECAWLHVVLPPQPASGGGSGFVAHLTPLVAQKFEDLDVGCVQLGENVDQHRALVKFRAIGCGLSNSACKKSTFGSSPVRKHASRAFTSNASSSGSSVNRCGSRSSPQSKTISCRDCCAAAALRLRTSSHTTCAEPPTYGTAATSALVTVSAQVGGSWSSLMATTIGVGVDSIGHTEGTPTSGRRSQRF